MSECVLQHILQDAGDKFCKSEQTQVIRLAKLARFAKMETPSPVHNTRSRMQLVSIQDCTVDE